MRFLILTQYYPPEIGAAQLRLSAVARSLTMRGHEVEVVTGMPNYPHGRIADGYRGKAVVTEMLDGVRVRRTWLMPATGSGGKRMLNYLTFTATSLPAGAAMQRPDVVLVESPPLTLAVTGWAIARRWGVPMVLNVSDLWPDSALQLELVRDGAMARAAARLERWAYRRATLINAVTDGIRNALIERKDVPPRKVLFLPNGVDTDVFRPLPRDEALAQALGLADRAVILVAGTMIYAAGLDVVLAAAERLTSRPVTFLLVGGGSERERIGRLVHERSLQNVVMLEPQPPAEIPRLYSIAAAGLMTLRDSPLFEGTRPARILATMACGKPVIYSGAGEGARMVDAAEAGIVVPPQDPDALAGAVAAVVDDPERAAVLGANGRRYVETELSWDRLVGAWLDQLTERLPQPRTAAGT